MFDKPLIRKSSIIPSEIRNQTSKTMLETNFDSFTVSLFCEVQYWEKLRLDEFEIPHPVLRIYQQVEDIRVLQERVMTLVHAYNEIIGNLSENEFILFSDHLRHFEKKIHPGLSKLMWSSRSIVIDKFIKVTLKQKKILYDNSF